jgi:Family of unknown function (DUF6416)
MTTHPTVEEPMLEIKIMVPATRLGDFYQWYGGWLRGDEMLKTNLVTNPNPIGNPPWSDTPEDLELASQLWEKMSEDAKRMIRYLIDHQSEGKIDGGPLSEALGIPNSRYGLAGVLAWPGRYCNALGRRLPTRHDDDGYWMEPEVARLFSRIVDGEQA